MSRGTIEYRPTRGRPTPTEESGADGYFERTWVEQGGSPYHHQGGSADGDLAPETQVGSYIVEARIAAGGFGTVYRVRHRQSGEPAALKLLHAVWAMDASWRQRFAREVEIARSLKHRHLVDIYEVGEFGDGRPFFVMELLHGSSLDAVSARGPLAPRRVLDIIAPLCEALAAAHERGIIHRDIKPSNVFLAQSSDGSTGNRPDSPLPGNERVVLLDFGIAKLLDPDNAQLTASRQLLGSPASMAPEQIAGGPVGPATDVYGLGILSYQLLTGMPPFVEASATVVRYLHRYAERPRPSAKIDIAPELDDLIIAAMNTDAGRRPGNVGEFLARFRAAVVGHEPTHPQRQMRAAFAAYLEWHCERAEEVQTDEALVDDLATTLSLAGDLFTSGGFVPVLETCRGALFVMVSSDTSSHAEDKALRQRALVQIRSIYRQLQDRPGKHADALTSICVSSGQAEITAGAPTDAGAAIGGPMAAIGGPMAAIRGPITELCQWLPGMWCAGISGHPAVFSGTGLRVESIAEDVVRISETTADATR